MSDRQEGEELQANAGGCRPTPSCVGPAGHRNRRVVGFKASSEGFAFSFGTDRSPGLLVRPSQEKHPHTLPVGA